MSLVQRYGQKAALWQAWQYAVVDVQRRPGFDHEAQSMTAEARALLDNPELEVAVFYRYEMLLPPGFELDATSLAIFADAVTDTYQCTPTILPPTHWCLGIASLPGQFDARSQCASQALSLVAGQSCPVLASKGVMVKGTLSDTDKAQLMAYWANPVEMEVFDLQQPATFGEVSPWVGSVPVMSELSEATTAQARQALCQQWGLAMREEDLQVVQEAFLTMGRAPTETELKVLDTYWSDHCRHRTFHTELVEVRFDHHAAEASWQQAQAQCERLKARGIKHLMDVATLAAKALKREPGFSIDESEEINAAAIRVTLQGVKEGQAYREPWIYYFKNETHNHPTEIEPFGGAATCLGGAIRDPLSGRSYVYQSMRITGCGNPLTPLDQTLPGKRAQHQITTLAAKGFSSYGNQIGLATGWVEEFYHPGYVAKRLEVGAVVGAAPAANVVRSTPKPGDVVVLVGGATGRDGCGGATGSSKTHGQHVMTQASAEVQKGNPVQERQLQRLFRHREVARMIKRCNDFGAGGVCVAMGELADGMSIDLGAIPKKYVGLSPTELAISESQERMACVIASQDWPAFEKACQAENVEARVVAHITEAPRLVMHYEGMTVVDLPRELLNAGGAARSQRVHVEAPNAYPAMPVATTLTQLATTIATDLNMASQAGLIQHFDASIGAGSVLMPLGGKTQRTPTQAMAALLPVQEGTTSTASVMSVGFEPWWTEADPYQGAYDAVSLSVMKLMATGVPRQAVYLSLQEYFPSLRQDAQRWGRPLAALLGAWQAQMDWKAPAIGGKDSMSGSFEHLDVPSTLLSFATTVVDASELISSELKGAGHTLYWVSLPMKKARVDRQALEALWDRLTAYKHAGQLHAMRAVNRLGVLASVLPMAWGNNVGVRFDEERDLSSLGFTGLGWVIEGQDLDFEPMGVTIHEPMISWRDETLSLEGLWSINQGLESVFPTKTELDDHPPQVPVVSVDKPLPAPAVSLGTKPLVVMPVFAGTNCEVDTERAWVEAGAKVQTILINNRDLAALDQSQQALMEAMGQAQVLMLPGGFSMGDEPDGSAKFMVAFFRQARLTEAVHRFLARDTLMLGICNGFQALIKLGLVPYGEIRTLTAHDCTLTHNAIGRHQSGYVRTRLASNASPWLAGLPVGEVYSVPISHGEGRFVCTPECWQQLVANGQVATQYVDEFDQPSMLTQFNPNGSFGALEGLLSPDGRIFGKMGHTERSGRWVGINVADRRELALFAKGVAYFG